MDISTQGFGQKTLTFLTDTDDLQVGEPVIMSSNNTVKRPTLGKFIFGFCSGVYGDYVSVIVEGVVTVPFSGSAPLLGTASLVCDGSSGVMVDSEPLLYYHVLETDSTNKTLTFIL